MKNKSVSSIVIEMNVMMYGYVNIRLTQEENKISCTIRKVADSNYSEEDSFISENKDISKLTEIFNSSNHRYKKVDGVIICVLFLDENDIILKTKYRHSHFYLHDILFPICNYLENNLLVESLDLLVN